MIAGWFKGIQKDSDFSPAVFNSWWNKFQSWWNDHDRGVLQWDHVQIANAATNANDAVIFSQVGTQTDWASYTPTIAGCGTVGSVSFWWRQIGNTVYVRGGFQAGTPTAANFTITLPNSTTINTAHIPGSSLAKLGDSRRLTATVSNTSFVISDLLAVFSDGSTNSTVFCAFQANAGQFVKVLGNVIFNANDWWAGEFSYPI